MGLLLGSKDLGLKVDWRFGFVGYGHSVDTTPGVIYLDVGGSLRPGVVDHHSGGAHATGTADLVLHHPELVYNHLLGPWLERAALQGIPPGTGWQPTVIVHREPDWDALVATYLVQELVESGGYPPWAEALAAYTTEVDQGRFRLSTEPGDPRLLAPHLAFLALQHSRTTYAEQMRRGLQLVRKAVELIARARTEHKVRTPWNPADFLPPSPGASSWAEDPDFKDLADLLASDQERFKRDEGRCLRLNPGSDFDEVLLPAADGGDPIRVKAWVASSATEALLNKYWARVACPFTIIPVGYPEPRPEDPRKHSFNRVILSVDPTFRHEGRAVDLRGLGFALEQAESRTRRQAHEGHEPRGGSPRFPDGYCDNADPWYDGRGHEFTIVDTPNTGTVLDYGTILDIATGQGFWETPLQSGVATLVWIDPRTGGLPEGAAEGPLSAFPDMAPTLEAYRRNTRVTAFAGMPGLAATEDFCQVTQGWRRFPEGTCGHARVIQIRVLPGATLEGLTRVREKVVRTCGENPDYLSVRVTPSRAIGGPDHVRTLLRRLADSEVGELPGLDAGDELLLFNNRTLMIQALEGTLEHAPQADATADPDLEILLYTAFLNECLVRYSQRIADVVPSEFGQLDAVRAGELRRDVLRFQTLYYQIEVSRRSRNRRLFNGLREALDLPGHLEEVQGELDRLADIEARLEAVKAERATWMMNMVLVAIAFMGLASMVASIAAVPPDTLKSRWFWLVQGCITLAAVGLAYGLHRRRWREARVSPGKPDRGRTPVGGEASAPPPAEH